MDGSALPGGRRQKRQVLMLGVVLMAALGGAAYFDNERVSALNAGLRDIGLTLLTPVRWVGGLPDRWARSRADSAAEGALEAEFAAQREALLLAQTQLLGLKALEQENQRLRQLLSANERLHLGMKVVDVARGGLHPYTHRVVLAAGSEQGLAPGQPVLGRNGLLGQIRSTTAHEAVVTLATEPEHAIPAKIQRNGAATIVHGTGDPRVFRVSWLPQNTDIRIGDVLLSSGLGGRFPADYPVAEVTAVLTRPGEQFLTVTAKPVADVAMNPEVIVGLDAARP